MTITARYPGRCAKCGHPVNIGDEINWDAQRREAIHVTCPAIWHQVNYRDAMTRIHAGGQPAGMHNPLAEDGAEAILAGRKGNHWIVATRTHIWSIAAMDTRLQAAGVKINAQCPTGDAAAWRINRDDKLVATIIEAGKALLK